MRTNLLARGVTTGILNAGARGRGDLAAAAVALCLGNNLFEDVRIFLCESGENFSIYGDRVFSKRVYEAGIGEPKVLSCRGIYLDLPETAKIAFFPAAMGKGVFSGMGYGLARLAFFFRATETIPLHFGEYISAPFC